MGTSRVMHRQTHNIPGTYSIEADYSGRDARRGKDHSEGQNPDSAFSAIEQSEDFRSQNIKDFFKGLSSEAKKDFELHIDLFQCESGTVLFTAAQAPSKVLFLLKGKVRLSLNSNEGERLIIGVAGAGQILGLASATCGCAHQITAEAEFSCCVASIGLQAFLDFILRYPIALENVAHLLSQEYQHVLSQEYLRVCKQLHALDLIWSAGEASLDPTHLSSQ